MALASRVDLGKVMAAAGLAAGLFVSQAGHTADLRAGASRVVITPSPEQFPYQVGNEKPFVGVHDDVNVRALVIGSGNRRVVIVSAEVTAIPEGQELVRIAAEAAGVPAENVLLTASHTHNALLVFYHGNAPTPVQQLELSRLRSATRQAVKEAVEHMQTARLSFARGSAYANINNGEESGSRKWFDGAGSSDKTLDVLRVQDEHGQPLALMVNYATHAEVMYRSVTLDQGYEVSGDLPGATSHLLESSVGIAPVVLFTSAAEGDQLSLFKSLQPDEKVPGIDAGASGWVLLDLQARRIATAVMDLVGSMPSVGDAQATIKVASGGAVCPGVKRTRDASGGFAGAVDTADVTIPLQVLRIGDVVLAGIGADLASDIGVAIKTHSPVRHTSVVTMTAGSVGYVLNDAAYVKPGHGAMGSPVKPGCAPSVLPARVAELIESAR